MEYFLQMLQTISVADPKRLHSDSNQTFHFIQIRSKIQIQSLKKQKHSNLNLSTVTFYFIRSDTFPCLQIITCRLCKLNFLYLPAQPSLDPAPGPRNKVRIRIWIRQNGTGPSDTNPPNCEY